MRPATTPPHRSTLVFLSALATLTLNMFLPSLANIADDLGASYALVSLAVGGYLGIAAGVHLLVGPMADRFGRRPVLLVGLTLFVVASTGCALATDIRVFLLFRILQGAIVAGSALAMVMVRDTTTAARAAGTIGYITMAMALAPMLGPMVGGFLDAALGWRAIFWFFAISGAALLVLTFVDAGETRPPGPRASSRGLLILLGHPGFWAFSLTGALSTAGFFMFLAGAPLIADRVFGIGVGQVGIYIGSITAGFMTGAALSGRFAPRFGLTRMLIAGRLMAVVGLAGGLGAFLAGAEAALFFFGATIFIGIGNGLTLPSANTGAMSVRPDLAGSAGGLSAAINVGSGAVLTSLTGLLIARFTDPAVLLALMLAVSAGALAAAFWAHARGDVADDA